MTDSSLLNMAIEIGVVFPLKLAGFAVKFATQMIHGAGISTYIESP